MFETVTYRIQSLFLFINAHIFRLSFSLSFTKYIAVTQDYRTDAQIVYVIIGNAALMKCEIPSFVADFVTGIAYVQMYYPREKTSKIVIPGAVESTTAIPAPGMLLGYSWEIL